MVIDTPAQIAERRRVLLEATAPKGTRDGTVQDWPPCPGSGEPVAGHVLSNTADGRRMASGWCSHCGRFGGAKWTVGQNSKAAQFVVARKHLDRS